MITDDHWTNSNEVFVARSAWWLGIDWGLKISEGLGQPWPLALGPHLHRRIIGRERRRRQPWRWSDLHYLESGKLHWALPTALTWLSGHWLLFGNIMGTEHRARESSTNMSFRRDERKQPAHSSHDNYPLTRNAHFFCKLPESRMSEKLETKPINASDAARLWWCGSHGPRH